MIRLLQRDDENGGLRILICAVFRPDGQIPLIVERNLEKIALVLGFIGNIATTLLEMLIFRSG